MKKLLLFVPIFCFLLTSLTFSQDQGMTGETHKKNIGKSLWAKERIQLNKQDQTKYDTVFDVSDPLYGRIFLEKSLPRFAEDQGADCRNPYANFKLKVYINGEDKGYINEAYFYGGEAWTTAQINLHLSAGDKADNINRGIPEKWADLVKGLPNGEHQCKFEFYGGEMKSCLLKVAEGSFTLNKTGEMVTKKLDKLPDAKKKDSALENEMIAAIKKLGWQNESPIKVVIIEEDWRIIRDALGNILRKEINTNVVLKKNDGNCRLTDISFERPYRGNNKYGSTEVFGIGLMNEQFNCNAVK